MNETTEFCPLFFVIKAPLKLNLNGAIVRNEDSYRFPLMVMGLTPDFLAARRVAISCISLPMLE